MNMMISETWLKFAWLMAGRISLAARFCTHIREVLGLNARQGRNYLV
jgi:hypothetical protein